MKTTQTLIARILLAVSPPLAAALRASERLYSPQLDAGCKPAAPPAPKPRR